jgi:YD repeat-containing protein
MLDPVGGATIYEYSVLNQKTKIIDPLGGQTTFTYDANGNMLTLTDARAKTTTWTYDNMDRVATRTDPLSRSESFTYNENGVVKTWRDRKGQITADAYDALDRQTLVGFGATGTPPTYVSTVTTTYDTGDRATSLVDSVAGRPAQQTRGVPVVQFVRRCDHAQHRSCCVHGRELMVHTRGSSLEAREAE